MKASVKQQQYLKGQSVYYSEGVSQEYFRGTIIDCLKISVRILNTRNEVETINKNSLGIVI